ncbi:MULTISPECIES: Uma2 family endonuclease [Methylobacterium]|nr:Uma2 family endonuclease [Methylobacterium ajmalii]
MDVDAFLAWSATVPGRHELVDGEVFARAPERARHARVRFAVQSALDRGLRALGSSCEMLPDGVTVRIDARTASEPDALVDCGPRMDPDAVEAPPPVIVARCCRREPGRSMRGRSSRATSCCRASCILCWSIRGAPA